MKIVLIGASEHARVVLDSVEREGRYQVAGVFDHRPLKEGFHGYPYFGGDEELFKSPWRRGVVTIGDNYTRARVVERTLKALPDFEFVTVVHPSAQIGKDVRLGGGTVVMAGVTINPNSQVGEHCILNTQSSLDHDGRMGAYSSLGPGAILGGQVSVGPYTAVSLGASVIHGMSIGEHTVVGAGATVVKDIPSHSVALGVPARVVRQREAGERYL